MVSVEITHPAYVAYMDMPALAPSHLLDVDQLTEVHHALGGDEAPRRLHVMAGIWATLELAQARDFADIDNHAEAQELIGMAKRRAAILEDTAPSNRRSIFSLCGARLLGLYAEHYAQLGPARWEAAPTEFQMGAYASVQQAVVDPMLTVLETAATRPVDRSFRETLRDRLSDLVVLQALNRLQLQQEAAEWVAVPASTRESSRTLQRHSDQPREFRQSPFDVKLQFADHTFIPLVVRSRNQGPARRDSSIDPRAAVVYTLTKEHNSYMVAKAMQAEVCGQPLDSKDRLVIEALTGTVLRAVCQTDRLGDGIYPGDSLEAAAADLALWALADRHGSLPALP